MNQSQIDLTIIIVAWNSLEDLKRCLPALKSSRYHLQVIIVDNSASVELQQWLSKINFAGEYLGRQNNLGFSAGCNQGARQAKGRYLLFLNPDTVVYDEALTLLITWMDENSDVACCGPRLVNQDGSLQHSTRRFPTLFSEFCQEFMLSALMPTSDIFSAYYMAHWNHQTTKQVDAVMGAALMIKKEVFDDVGHFDEKMSFMYYEELDLCLRLKHKGYKTFFIHQAVVEHFGASSSKKIGLQSRRYLLNSRFNYFKKNRSWWIYILLYGVHIMSGIAMSSGLFLFCLLKGKYNKGKNLAKVYLENIRFSVSRINHEK